MSDIVDQLRGVAAASLAPTEGELAVGGLREPVEVLRDGWGVPYLSAASLDDLWFAQGFVTAGERLFQIDLALRAANGRLSEVFADLTVDDDRFVRTIGLHRAGATLAARYDDDSRTMAARFVEGVFAWIERMPSKPIEYTLLDLEPDLPRDEASWASTAAYLAWNLSGNAYEESLRADIAAERGPDEVARLLPPMPSDRPPIAAGSLSGLLPAPPPGAGSNNWAVAGSRTATGKPLLANDPHLEATQPGAWLEMGLRAPGYEARGVALPFMPGIIIGATPHHAWGVTNVTGDVQDLYVEHLNEAGTAARLDDAWEPLTFRREEIAVRGHDEPSVLEVRESRHGPILESIAFGEPVEYAPLTETYALRWTGHEHGIQPSAFVRAAQATSFEAFREAVRGVECPGQNVVYADVEGTIGYQCTGAYPVRRTGDGSAPVPGWTSEHEWDGWIPFEELPWSTDPQRGFLVTANNRIHDDAYPHLIGVDFHAPHRARRITERLEAEGLHTVAGMAHIQVDTVSIPARTMLPSLVAVEATSDRVREGLDILSEWDGDLRADSAAAGLYQNWIARIARRVVGDAGFAEAYHATREPFVSLALPAMLGRGEIGGDLLIESLEEALLELGPDPTAWRWGEMHTLRLVHPLGRMPGLEGLFVAAEIELGGDEQTVSQGGFDGRAGFRPVVIASWRAVWDLDDLDRSVTVLPAGVSGNPASPHWNDQSPLWAAGETHPAPVTRAGIESAAVATLRLLPG
jgi:penicillin amidase